MPSLTILLLCWNHERYLEKAIEALGDQTNRDIELLFLDNFSSDDSFELAQRLLKASDLPHKAVRNVVPRSISANLNTLLSQATGELVTFLSTDDWVEPDYVETMIAAAEARPDCGWFSCSGWMEFEQTGEARPVDASSFAHEKNVPQAILDGDNPFFFVGCCYRRTVLEAVGGWDETMTIEDRDLFYRLGKISPHGALPNRLVHYRMHDAAASANQTFMIDGWERFYAKHAADFGTAGLRRQRAQMYQRAAAVMVDRGDLTEARWMLAQSLRLAPVNRTAWQTLAYWLRRRLG